MKHLVVGACALMLLAACQRDSASSDSPSTGSEDAASAEAPAIDPARAAAQLTKYKKALIGVVAGRYAGECRDANGSPFKDGVTIEGTGAATAQGWKGHLTEASAELSVVRTVTGDGSAFAVVYAASEQPKWNLSLNGERATADFDDGKIANQCSGVRETQRLGTHALYAPLAPFFVAGKTTLGCVEGQTINEAPVEAAATGARIGEREYSFVKDIKAERADIDVKDAELQYRVDYKDGRWLSLMVDGNGKISQVVTGGEGHVYTCAPPVPQ